MTPQLDPESEPGPGDWIIQLPSEKVELILDRFEQERAKGEPPKEATAILLKAAEEVVVRKLCGGAEPEKALNAVGLPFSYIGITYIFPVKGGVKRVPSPECMASHLPRGRKASREELKEAWEKCCQ